MLHQVLKKFKAEGKDQKVGDLIETSHWKNERLLLEHRFIGKPSTPEEEKAKVRPGNKIVKNSKPLKKAQEINKINKPPKPPAIIKKQGVVGSKMRPIGKVPVAKSKG